MLTIAQRRNELERRVPEWRPLTLHGMLDWAAGQFPDEPYLITDQRCWTYEEVAEWSRRIAGGLASAGVGRNDKVAIILANYPEFAPLKFAISRLGAVAVPINMLNRKDELQYLLKQSDTKLLVTMSAYRDNDYLAALDDIAPEWETNGGGDALPLLERVVVFDTGQESQRNGAFAFEDLASHDPAPDIELDAGELCDIIYTSGTTGAPKGVMLTHDMLTRTAYGAAYARAFEPGHRIVFSLPMYHVFGYVEGLLAVPWVGGAIVPQLKFDAHETLAAIERHRASDVLLIPTMTLSVLDAARESQHDLSSLHFALASGGRAPARIWSALYEVLGITEVTTGYGMTETTATTMLTRPEDPFERVAETNGCNRRAGRASEGADGEVLVTYRVVDPDTLSPVPAGETGELVACGLGVTTGYYRKEAETAAAFTPDGWLRTGDLGQIDREGYLRLVGRTKESYRCGGELVMPTEVEDLLTKLPEVLQAHVVPIPDERMGEVGVAFVVPAQGADLDTEMLRDLVASKVARFKVPKHFLLVSDQEVPTTASGRARKFMLSQKAVEVLGATR